MAVRTSMTSLIFRLRTMTETEQGTETLQDEDLWTDARLQEFLDSNRTDHVNIQLVPVPYYVDGTWTTIRYEIPIGNSQNIEPSGSDSLFAVVDSIGNAAPSHTVYLDAGYIIFDSTTSGLAYFLRASWYDIRHAAAEIWKQKAAQRASLIEWKAGQHSLKEDQEYKHCIEMYRLYASGIRAVRLRKEGYANSV